ncbi:hypothetical protein DH2020_013027 [Rehmannia glutinosa]|uniref:ribose-5-phosphate isomerase n=1 Tax=Rehmannia glutinosa TaxID=99300 RepID=A0ABR0X116_REHGL
MRVSLNDCLSYGIRVESTYEVSFYLYLKKNDVVSSSDMSPRANRTRHVMHNFVNHGQVGSQYGVINYLFDKEVKLHIENNQITMLNTSIGLQNPGPRFDTVQIGVPVEIINMLGDRIRMDLSNPHMDLQIWLECQRNDDLLQDVHGHFRRTPCGCRFARVGQWAILGYWQQSRPLLADLFSAAGLSGCTSCGGSSLGRHLLPLGFLLSAINCELPSASLITWLKRMAKVNPPQLKRKQFWVSAWWLKRMITGLVEAENRIGLHENHPFLRAIHHEIFSRRPRTTHAQRMLSLFRSPPPHSHPHPPPHHPLQILHQSLLRPSPHPRRPKKLVADKAVEYVKSNMVLGLGTGSTAAFVVDKLGALLKSGELADIMGVLTSKRTQEQVAALGIPLSTLNAHPHLDLAIDGADEVDPNLDPVKGRGL